MSEKDKILTSTLSVISDVNNEIISPTMTEFLMPSMTHVSDIAQGISHCADPSTEHLCPTFDEPWVLDCSGVINNEVVNESPFENDILNTDKDSVDSFSFHLNQHLETEKVFEVPLVNDSSFSSLPDSKVNAHESHLESKLHQGSIIEDNEEHNEETNSDTTVEYSLEDIQLEVPKSDTKTSISPTIIQSFSPLPSTSSDHVIMNINDIWFNKVASSPESEWCQDIKQHMQDVKLEEKTPPLEGSRNKIKGNSQEPSIVECSSESENGDDEVIICGISKPNVIDLSNDDVKYDSDCEIVDVDNIITENKKVLDVTQISPPTVAPRRLNTDVVGLNNSVEITYSSVEPVPAPLPLHQPEVDVVLENQLQEHTSTPSPQNYYPYSELKSLLDFLAAEKPESQNGTYNGEGVFHNAFSNNPVPLYPSTDSQNVHRRKSRRIENHNKKRRRIDSVIDLSVTSTLKPNSSSDVIVIDVDSPVSIQSSNNVAQISVSIVAPMSTSVEGQLTATVPTTQHCTAPSASVPTPDPSRRLGDCPVCLENFSKVKAVSTFCGHLFCLECINTVKLTSKKCPTCRNQLKGKGYHPIFL